MKNLIHTLLILFCFLLQTNLFANTVIVKGYVKDSANNPIANRTVKIYSTDSSNQGCLLSHSVLTNPNGYYIDTLTCNGVIRKLAIIVENCNGTRITHDPAVTTSNIVESNFIICATPSTPPTNCKAAFSYVSTAIGIKFNAAGSQAPDGDSIISRSWSFGDNSEVSHNIDPVHAYTTPGSYTVCLTIQTKKGCESRYCTTVVFTPESNGCKVELKVTSEKIAPKKFHFFSNLSTALVGDSIVQRTWKFGDGSSLDGNQASPIKEYKDTGIYNVCVQARTVKGCEKLYCFTVTVHDTVPGTQPVNCKAYFTYSIKDSTVSFNSAVSTATSGEDSIISRTWYFIDSSKGPNAVVLTGNVIAPAYTYAKPGTYVVYLLIKTKKGCESQYTTSVYVPALFRECHVEIHVNVEKSNAAARRVRFTSNTTTVTPGDSIIQRIWKFGDNTYLEGNEIYPVKEYKDTGAYTVCIRVKTVRGCVKEYCFSLIIRDTVVSTSCKAGFTYASSTQIAGIVPGIKFNSAGSVTAAGDSIISRTWTFGDSTETLTGNRVDPSHNFAKPGTYNVCLAIKTKNGCESKYCTTITIRPVLLTCKAYFTYTQKDSTIYFNSEGSQATSSDDSIISRTWYYMDNTISASLSGNVINPSYTYTKPGSYTVYLVIKTKKGCESKYAGTVVIAPRPVPTNCKALFTYTLQNSSVKFNSTSSTATSADDSITSRTWYFGDNTDKLAGNSIDPLHAYAKPGTYIAYLYIKTHKGCESKYSATIVIDPAPTNCKALFTYTIQNAGVKFNSASSTATSADDSIISRNWVFGDTAHLTGNNIDPLHIYAKAGTYHVYLYIKTKKGCESKYEGVVTIAPVNCAVQVQFTAERDGKKVQFNSSHSSALQDDSIIQRRWKFGDGTVLEGNVVSPLKEFSIQGVYNTCLQVRTAQGCEAQLCKQVMVQDSLRLPATSVDYLKIISINPNPVTTRMMATLWSHNNNVEVEIAIYDIYGTPKMNLKKVLTQGNNIIEISTIALYHGPYFLKVSSRNGRDTKAFYKL